MSSHTFELNLNKARVKAIALVALMVLSTSLAVMDVAASNSKQYPAARNPRDLATGDFDCDGDEDIVTASDMGNFLAILWNDGGTYEERMDIWVSNTSMGSRCVVVECVGAPGVLNEILITAPWSARVIVAGQNLDDEVLFTASAHTKGINVQFGGSTIGQDYVESLNALASGTIDVSFWQTGHVDLDGAVDAFAESTDTERHTRIAVYPNGKELMMRIGN